MKIISGGQTGVDRAALDYGLEKGYSIGGWCPKGRLAEDGIIPLHYPLDETPTSDYDERTKWNVQDSDGTLIIAQGTVTGGTAHTRDLTSTLSKPLMMVDLYDVNFDTDEYGQPSLSLADNLGSLEAELSGWLLEQEITILNIAGPRESGSPGIYFKAKSFLLRCLKPIENMANL
ncbi:MAG: putative molybdenum carrier protein [Bacteroidetes bacterium]|nr:putative molybdenum carrier protein [Bacteroidota bacterium]